MKSKFIIFIHLFLFIFKSITSEKIRHEEFLDTEKKYFLAWEFEKNEENVDEITIEATVQTLGWVGLGLSTNGRMLGADIIIGGIYPNLTKYFTDRHGVGNVIPKIDPEQNWELLDAFERDGNTTIIVKRKLITCDKNDLEITDDLLSVIWSYGATDEITSAGHIARGQQQFNLLDSPNPPLDLTEFVEFEILMKPPTLDEIHHTVYWITYHKIDIFEDGPMYLIGFDPSPTRSTNSSEEHTHHYIVSRCVTPDPEDASRIYDPLLNEPGWETGNFIPGGEFCRTRLYAWAKGGKMMLFPEHLGFTMGEHGNEYLFIEVHYDNPHYKEMDFYTGFKLYFSKEKREFEAGLLPIGIPVNPMHFLPPKTSNFLSSGHCSSECTRQWIPEGGIKIFNALLHSHLAGRKITMRHFRGDRELPWVIYDNNYDFDFQQNRNLRREITILPGDQLTTECTFDTSDRSNVTMSGQATNEEMCQIHFWYYPRIKLQVCSSAYYDGMEMARKFGIEGFNEPVEYIDTLDPIVNSPSNLNGKRLSEVLNDAEWTENFKREIEQMHRLNDHGALCLSVDRDDDDAITSLNMIDINWNSRNNVNLTRYPTIKGGVYQLPDLCSASDKTILLHSFLLIFTLPLIILL